MTPREEIKRSIRIFYSFIFSGMRELNQDGSELLEKLEDTTKDLADDDNDYITSNDIEDLIDDLRGFAKRTNDAADVLTQSLSAWVEA